MSLSIFSFDLQALIDSLSNFNFIDTPEQPIEPSNNNTSLDSAAAVLQNATGADTSKDDGLMADALSSVITSVLTSAENTKSAEPVKVSAENVKNETAVPTTPVQTPVINVPKFTLDEAATKELEDLIKSLQTSVIHSYQSTDVIDANVSLTNVTNFTKKNLREDRDNNTDKVQEDRKKEATKLQNMQEELKKAMMKNNSNV